MSTTQGRVIIGLLTVLILIGGLLAFLLVRDDGQQAEAQPEPTTVETSTTPTSEEVVDPATLLAETEMNSIHPAPAPEAPQAWGDYQLDTSWDGEVRVFEGNGPESISGENGAPFPSSMNACGVGAYLVTFRSINPEVSIAAHQIDAAGNSATSSPVNEGWMLHTNCETPAFEFLESEDSSNLGDVAYTVHLYRQGSTAPATQAEQAEPESSVETIESEAPAAAPQPTFVQCLGTLGPAMALYSDGSERYEPSCENSPERQRANRAESVCGGWRGWERVGVEEYTELCGHAPPTYASTEPTY